TNLSRVAIGLPPQVVDQFSVGILWRTERGSAGRVNFGVVILRGLAEETCYRQHLLISSLRLCGCCHWANV
ncbi:MAG TPA: hypothetical protein VGJ66_11830, partial [Pyrinomonadaceae bacterium]